MKMMHGPTFKIIISKSECFVLYLTIVHFVKVIHRNKYYYQLICSQIEHKRLIDVEVELKIN